MKACLNPFASHHIDHLSYKFVSINDNWSQLYSELENLDYHGALVGPHGSGKTTLLTHLVSYLKNQNHDVLEIFINQENPRLTHQQFKYFMTPAKKKTTIIFDGADLLPRWHWNILKRMLHQSKGLIITAHQHGLLPTLYTTSITKDLMDTIVKDLTKTNETDHTLKILSHSLFKKYDGNMHEVIRNLYLEYANKKGSSL